MTDAKRELKTKIESGERISPEETIGLFSWDLIELGKLEEAFRVLEQARPSVAKPDSVDNLLGVICAKLGKQEQAEFYFKRAIEQEANNAQVHLNLGLFYMETNRQAKAVKELAIAAQLNPAYETLLSGYGVLQEKR